MKQGMPSGAQTPDGIIFLLALIFSKAPPRYPPHHGAHWAYTMAVGVLSTAFTVLKTVILAPVIAVKALVAAFALLKAAMITTKVVALAMWSAIASPAFIIGAALAILVGVVWKLTGAWKICSDAVDGLAGDFKTAFAAIKT